MIGFLGDFDLAEEAVQEAFAIAADRWRRDGYPANPRAWLVTTARNRAIDRIRRDQTRAAKTSLPQVRDAAEDTRDAMEATTFPDERLELIFTCCHPALAMDARVALTLRTLGGLTTDEIVLLADQDRSLWDASQIADGRIVLDRALALRGRGPYVVQAAIASLHADEPRDRLQIAALYGELARLTDSPVVELSRAVAVAEANGPQRGLDIIDHVALEDYHYLHSTRGELLRRLGRRDEARDAYRRALALVHDDAERRLLERRLAELGAANDPSR